ncbi:tyrosine-type recombinase/integrase [Clostridium chromiireducens]|uniref:Tyrosine-type recombinase/integrase n=1 Tax=Clostridium chromiireducens TaxID=225345 RepID=A0A964RT54_9CLOT|nr:tyrosine-type recombinase/integrase [Clostridium chromiireducens]MVX67377.1 tyrosine-type recombinase/integrase [Clostridium chromiireducens]
MNNSNKLKIFKYTGPLSEMLEGFIRQKRALGCQYNSEAGCLAVFDRFTMNFNFEKNTLPKYVVDEWIRKKPNEKNLTQIKRINLIKQVGQYIKDQGQESYIPPSKFTSINTPIYIPYIFSAEEIKLLLQYADAYQSTIRSPYLHLIVPVVFRILYGCGLRVSEVLRLQVKDIDLEHRVLTIRNTKFSKDRYVPMASSLNEKCSDYLKRMHPIANPEDYFIKSPSGYKYTQEAVYYWFRVILWKIGISHGGKGHGPRVHDLRHTFAVHCLKRWVLNEKDITAALPVLSAYLGHSDLRGTQIYLRLTADLFPSISTTMDKKFGGDDE